MSADVPGTAKSPSRTRRRSRAVSSLPLLRPLLRSVLLRVADMFPRFRHEDFSHALCILAVPAGAWLSLIQQLHGALLHFGPVAITISDTVIPLVRARRAFCEHRLAFDMQGCCRSGVARSDLRGVRSLFWRVQCKLGIGADIYLDLLELKTCELGADASLKNRESTNRPKVNITRHHGAASNQHHQALVMSQKVPPRHRLCGNLHE